jgi:hypothetical protein
MPQGQTKLVGTADDGVSRLDVRGRCTHTIGGRRPSALAAREGSQPQTVQAC